MQLIFRHTQLQPGIGNGWQTQRHPEVDRRHVHGTRQGIHQHDLAAVLFVVVLRRPHLSVWLAQGNRSIGNPGVQTILVRLA